MVNLPIGADVRHNKMSLLNGKFKQALINLISPTKRLDLDGLLKVFGD